MLVERKVKHTQTFGRLLRKETPTLLIEGLELGEGNEVVFRQCWSLSFGDLAWKMTGFIHSAWRIAD